MVERPFADIRPFGPLIGDDDVTISISDPEGNWKDMDTDTLDGPPGWDWDIDDELAHHVWNLTEDTREVGFGPDPPILLQASMGFFDNKSLSDSVNNWYFTRIPGQRYTDYTEWWQTGTIFNDPEGESGRTDILYDNEIDPHPLRSRVTSQQYTTNGGMFTYEFDQWQGRDPSGMMRIPVPRDLLDDLRDEVEPTAFEEFQIQFRPYNQQFADGPAPMGDFAHPHFRPEGTATKSDFVELFEIAFAYMKRAVRMES